MINRPLHIICSLVLFVVASPLFSQEVSVRVGINRNKILIGEQIVLKLEARVPAGTAANWFPLDSLGHFDLVSKEKVDTVSKGDFTSYTQQLVITSFDSGRWSFPALALTVGNRNYLTDSLPVSVAYSNFDPKQDYHDIKDILELAQPELRYINWIVGGLALLALLVIILLLRKKQKAEEIAREPEPELPPLDEALQTMERLRQQGYAQDGQLKAFHSGMNDALRRFVYRKTGVRAMEKTSGELILQLQRAGLGHDSFVQLAQALRVGDAVKFAKYHPLPEENEQSFTTIKTAIGELDTITGPGLPVT